MIGLLKSYGVPRRRAATYTQRMAAKQIDERTLQQYGQNQLVLQVHLRLLGVSDNDTALISKCLHSGEEGKNTTWNLWIVKLYFFNNFADG